MVAAFGGSGQVNSNSLDQGKGLRVAILGSGGRLGAALARLWNPKFEVLSFSRKELDISQLGNVEKTLNGLSCDIVINCTGLTHVDYCEEHPAEALLLNATSPALMARICAERGMHFIHFSTDYVFDGQCQKLWEETDSAIPLNRYGYSKLEGETGVLEAGQTVLRVSWVFGPDKPSFLDSILHQAGTQARVAAVTDKTSCPTYTHDIAKWMEFFLCKEAEAARKGSLYHLCNSGECSWFDYGGYALDCAREYGIPLKATKIDPLKLSDMRSFQAKRPRYSALCTEKFAAVWGHPLRSWKDAVQEYIRTYKAKCLNC